jgi:hypothetical protein
LYVSCCTLFTGHKIKSELSSLKFARAFFPTYIKALIIVRMQTEYLQTVIGMLQSQLKEEHENYSRALDARKKLGEIKEIHQRIKSLEDSLYFIERSQQIFSSSKTAARVNS